MIKVRSRLEKMWHAQGMAAIFMETVMNPTRVGWHTCIECVPIDAELAETVPMYFKKALLDADEEWSSHKKVIDTSTKGLRNAVPPNFPYFHVQWFGGGYPPGGYAHIIEGVCNMLCVRMCVRERKRVCVLVCVSVDVCVCVDTQRSCCDNGRAFVILCKMPKSSRWTLGAMF